MDARLSRLSPLASFTRPRPTDADGPRAVTSGLRPALDSFDSGVIRGPRIAAEWKPRSFAVEGAIPPRTPPQTLEVNGIPIHTHGASQDAIDEAIRVVTVQTSNPEVAERLRQARVEIVIIPHDVALPSLHEFSDLAGRPTVDGGRTWDTVRGVGGHPRDGRVYVGIGEENLAGFDSPHVEGEFAEGFSIAHHEIAHVVENYGISAEARAALESNYRARVDLGLPFTDPYGASNADEYFAQAVNAYFRANNDGGGVAPGEQINSPEWIQQNDPVLYAHLEATYGPPPPPPFRHYTRPIDVR